MKTTVNRTRSRRKHARSGTAAVECAIVAPLLTLLVLGAIDLGQYADVYQKISDASREGARVASRYDTTSTSQVQAAVMGYLEDVSPDASPSTLAEAAQVTLSDGLGNPIPYGDLSQIPTGSQINVQVTLQYDPVRWIPGFNGLNGKVLEATTVMRRE